MNNINSMTSLSAKTGIGGLISGMDIDELVNSMTISHQQKILQQEQAVQILEWKQEGYRAVTRALAEFQASYLDILSPTNFRSTSLFNVVSAASSSAAVSVTASGVSKSSGLTIDAITQLAQHHSIAGTAVSAPLGGLVPGADGENPLDGSQLEALVDALQGQSISLTLDGRVKVLTFDDTFALEAREDLSEAGFTAALQGAVDRAFGVVDPEDRIISLSLENGHFSLGAAGSTLIAKAVGNNQAPLLALGLTYGKSNRIDLTTPIDNLSSLVRPAFDVATFRLTINGVDFEFGRGASLMDIMEKLDASDAGVKLAYSSITDAFTLTAKESGAGNHLDIVEHEGNLLSALGLTQARGAVTSYGKNALLTVNGHEIVRTDNVVEIDGLKLTLNRVTQPEEDPIAITLQDDSASLLEPIKKFVEDYNALIDLINGLLSEKADAKYQPLSEQQKNDMSEKQIEQWETKAKVGLLRGDGTLRNILSDLRSAMLLSVEGSGLSLADLGIASGSYEDYGKLKINDEEKLAEVLRTRGNELSKLFTDAKNGIAVRVNDIITGAVKRTGPQGQRGLLIQIAGIESSTSDAENNIATSIKNANKQIAILRARLISQESRLWSQFTAMETALQRLNIQSAMLMQFMGQD